MNPGAKQTVQQRSKQQRHAKNSLTERFLLFSETPAILTGLVLFLTLALLLIPLGLRFFSSEPLLVGTSSAKTLTILAQADFSSLIITTATPQSSQGIGVFFRVLKWIPLSGAGKLVVPLLFSLACAFIFLKVLLKHFSGRFSLLIMTLLVSTPLFLAIHLELSELFFTCFLFVCALFFMQERKEGWALLLLALLIIESPFVGVAASALLVLFSQFLQGTDITLKKKHISFFFPGLVLALLAGVSMLFSPATPYAWHWSVAPALSDLGNAHGFSIPFILLAIIGAIYLWTTNKGNIVLASLYALSILSFFWLPLELLALPFLAILGGYGTRVLIKRNWSYSFMKQFTLLLIFCALIFSTTTFFSVILESPPSHELVNALSAMRGALPERTLLLARPEIGEFISYYAGYPVVVDADAIARGTADWQIEKRALFVRNAAAAKRLFDETGTSWFVLDPSLIDEIHEEKGGVLFLIEATPDFRQVYRSGPIQVYLADFSLQDRAQNGTVPSTLHSNQNNAQNSALGK